MTPVVSRAALALVLLSPLALTGCTTSAGQDRAAASAPSTTVSHPVEVTNCGRTLRFEQAPTRIVSGWPTSTELLIELGAQQRVVGKYNTASATPQARYADAYQQIPTLGEGAPSREQLIAARPDLIWADGSYLFDGRQLPTIAELAAQGTQVMILSGFCDENATAAKIRDVDTDLAALGAILGLPDRTAALRADIDRRLAGAASAATAGSVGAEPVPVAFLGTYEKSLLTFEGVYTDIAQLAGARNLYSQTLPIGRYYGEISREHVIRTDPTTIVYLLNSDESEQAAGQYLSTALPTVAAVRNNRIIYLPQAASTNLAGVDAVVHLATALHPRPA